MKRKRKIFALLCLGTILYQTFSPLTALALTSGPASPDASSFEPVDTSTMVNPVTGDLVYNVPLMEVPGPEGSYPLSLSYHAGINPEQESSWVGLGWTLNPGSVTRSVNGFPDDWANTQASRRDYWSGGITTVTSVGVTIPYFNVSADVVIAKDTYRGLGIGWSASYGFSIFGDSGARASVGIGSDPYSGGVSVFGTVGVGALSLTGSLGENNSIGVSLSLLGIGPYNNLLGATLSTRGASISVNSPLVSKLSNSKEGIVQTETQKTSLDLLFVRYSKTRMRYWSDETENSNIYGALNTKSFSGLLNDNSIVNDSYNLGSGSVDIFKENSPEKIQEGAFPSFDNFTVTGQGIGGVMRLFQYQGSVSKQNITERTAGVPKQTVQYANNSKVSTNLGFRFLGDFSNTLQQNYTAFSTDPNTIVNGSLPFDVPSGNGASWSLGYSADQVLVGSKSVQYFKTDVNGNVIAPNNNIKFIQPVSYGLDRKKHLSPIAAGATNQGITGFSITNESGVTYHYNLPAYTYEEETYQENTVKQNSSDLKFNRQTKNAGYAYTWHLTAVTGPDYVDRGTVGMLDEADYGYWVSFEYGKWTDEFVWRTPTEGFTNNFDQRFVTVSLGKKEVYYLNAIKTRTHTALFEKDVRSDGKSASKESFNKNWSSQNNVSTNYNNTGIYNVNSNQSLRLSHVYILKNTAISGINTSLGGTTGLIPAGRTVACTECELPNNVFDKNDVNTYGRSLLEANCLRVIDFNYDYSLAKGATTSFEYANPSVKLGKLTLQSMKIRGKGGIAVMPQMEFGYNLSVPDQKKGQGVVSNGSITGANIAYQVGDLIETDEVNPVYCGYVDQVTQVGTTYTYVMKGGISIGNLGIKNIRVTKNPPYQKDKNDYWGMYKSDFKPSFNQNFSGIPTKASNRSTDVWSLRRVKTLIGAILKMEYEGHDFLKTVYSDNFSVQFTNFEKQMNGNYRGALINGGVEAKDFFTVGKTVRTSFIRQFIENFDHDELITDIFANVEVEIKSVQGQWMEIKIHPELEHELLNGSAPNRRETKIVAMYSNPYQFGDNRLGGTGVRVKSIELESLDGIRNKTEYFYRLSDGISSSGIALYEPLKVENPGFGTENENSQIIYLLNTDIQLMGRLGPEIPGPVTMYSRIETRSKVIYPNNDTSLLSGTTVSEYLSLSDFKVSIDEINSSSNYSTYSIRNLALRKFSSFFGTPKSVSYYDGNGKLTKRIVKQYLHEGVTGNFFTGYKARLQAFGYQGLLSERFSEVKKVLNTSNNTWNTLGTTIAREEYPLVNIGTVEYDYIHNTKTSTRVNAFDFYSGAVTESISTDSYGNSFLSQSTPAYRDFAAMGPNQLDGTKKNMLTQVSAKNVYRLNASGAKEYLVSADYNVWSNGGSVLNETGDKLFQNGSVTANGNVWRQTSSYIWMPSNTTANGMTVLATFVAFPGSNPAGANTAWKKNSEVVLTDPYSHMLSTKDFKGNYVSTRYGYNNAKPVLSGTFAKYGEIAFSGAEDGNISDNKKLEVKKGTGTVSATVFHTGKQSIQLTSGQTGFEYNIPVTELTASRTYTASVWVNKGAANNVKLYYQLDGVQKAVSEASTTSTKIAGNWALINFDITLSGGTAVRVFAKNDGTTTTYVDDFRFQPKNSTCSASIYDVSTGELTYSLDKNNLFTRYEYNAMGQVIATYREQFGRAPYKVSETQINQSTRSFNGLPN